MMLYIRLKSLQIIAASALNDESDGDLLPTIVNFGAKGIYEINHSKMPVKMEFEQV